MEAKEKSKIGTNWVFRIGFTALMIIAIFGCSKSDDGGAIPGSAENKVSLKSMSPLSPATLKFDEDVTITYDYEIAEPNGVRIWVQPYTNGQKSPKFSYTSSPLIKGKGSRTVVISVTSGETTVVDQLAIKIANADVSQTLLETFETVNYTFTN